MKWKDYVKRRRLNIELWLTSKGILDLNSMIEYLFSIGVESPTPEEINGIFPKPEPVVINVQEIDTRSKKRAKN